MAEAVSPIAELKQRMRNMWMAGNFGEIARQNEEWGYEFVSRLNLNPSMKVLDVGCGTGNQSIPAAKANADVTGVDIATNLLEQAHERAKRENLTIDFREGDAEELPFPDGEFDVVISMFAAMFAPRPELVAAELLRVAKPGGLIAMANWTPESMPAEMFRATAKYLPPPPNMQPAHMWGEETTVRQRLGAAAVKTERREFIYTFPYDAAGAVDFFRQYYGPTAVAFGRLDEKNQQALRSDLIGIYEKLNQGSRDAVTVRMEYLEVHARKA